MLESIIDLEKATVEDIMIPRSDIYGIDISDDIATVVNNFKITPYTRIPVYEDNIENLLGLVHIKNIAPLLASKSINDDEIKKLIKKPYYIVSGTSLYRQLINFQKEKRRIGFIIDEYGNVLGVAVAKLDVVKIVEDYGTLPENVNFGIKASAARNLLEGNQVPLKIPNTDLISKRDLSRLATDGTVYLTCWMTSAQLELMKSKKVMFGNLD